MLNWVKRIIAAIKPTVYDWHDGLCLLPSYRADVFINGRESPCGFTYIRTWCGFGYGFYDVSGENGCPVFQGGRCKTGITFGFFRVHFRV